MSDVDTLARTVWGEARGEGIAGMAAVAAVVMNRSKRPGWWGKDVGSVCLQPLQFSCWNKDDVNLSKLTAVDHTDQQFFWAMLLAKAAVDGALGDPTNGAVNYYARGTPEPSWALGMSPCAIIGNHMFFRE